MGRHRGWLALGTLIPLVSCGEAERPRIAIATNRDFADAAALAVADARAEWGDLPADTVVAVESFTRAAVAIQGAGALVTDGVDAVVGHSSSAASLAAAPVYNENEIVQLSPQSSASAYSDAGPYSFRLVPPDDRQGSFIASELRRMGVQRIVVLYVNDDYGRGLRSSLLAALGPNPPEVVGEAPHLDTAQPDSADLDLAGRVVRQGRPDAIVWLGRPFILERYLGVLRADGSLPVVGSDALSVLGDRSGAPWTDVWFVDFVDPAAGATMRDFNQRFEARFGRRVSSADALTYDATRMLLQAARDGAATGPEIRAWLESLGRERAPYAGITGPIRFDGDGDVDRSYVLRQVVPTEPVASETSP